MYRLKIFNLNILFVEFSLNTLIHKKGISVT